MLRKLLIALLILVLMLVGVGTFLYLKLRPSIREAEARAEAAEKILQPRILDGNGKFKGRAFYTAEGLGDISQIAVGWPADREGADIAVAGSHGADFISSAGEGKKKVRFSIVQFCPVTLARMSPTGEYGYLTRDESWAVPATLFNKEGNVSWRSKGNWPGVDDSAPGDVQGDGKLSVVIGFNGGGGIALLDEQGKQLWKKGDTDVWHVDMLDANGDGREEILHSNARGQLLLRDGNGAVTAQYLPGYYISNFALTRWGEETRPAHILVPTSESREGCCKPIVLILDAKGRTVTKLDLPLGNLFTRFSATPIRFGKNDEYFAILENRSTSNRSMLLLYDKDGQIVYQEILGESCLGLAPLPRKDGERLLVGCTEKILEYFPTLKISTSQSPTH
jgi:hypothetical protein